MPKQDDAGHEPAIVVKGLTRTFGEVPALRGIDLEITKGDCLAVLGPNGAGKTTLLKIIGTIISPSSGSVSIFGQSLADKDPEVRRHLGVVSHQSFLYPDLTAYENLKFYARMYDLKDSDRRINEVAELTGLTTRLKDRVNTFSRGLQQRLSIGKAILHRPEILLLDEPDTGLDWHSMASLWDIVRNEGEQPRTIIFSTHDITRGVTLSDRVLILDRGRIVFDEPVTPEDVKKVQDSYLTATGMKL